MSAGIPFTLRWLTAIGVLPKAAVTQLEVRRAPVAQSVLDAGRLAENTYALLDGLGHDIVLIARAGQNLEQYGLKYSHLGFAVKGLRRGEWGVVHLLNAGDGNRSGLFEEGMVNFYSDNPYRMESCVVTLPQEVQRTLLSVLKEHGRALHCSAYSLTSYPWSLTTQNSNQWVLEVLAAALAGQNKPTRESVQAWMREHGFEGTTLRIGLPTQWAAPLLRDCIRFEDQPESARREGQVQVITVESTLQWLLSEKGPLRDRLADVRVHPLSL